jgi:hypothetical protein
MGETRATFTPPANSVDVCFVKGMDRFSRIPARAARAGLNQRLAVIQETCVEGCIDMHFDELLWRTLADYVRAFVPGARIEVVTKDGRSDRPVSLDRFLEEWNGVAVDGREPPPLLLAISDGGLRLCMATEYWCNAGGPRPYHDSYTYSLYADRDLQGEVLAQLDQAEGRERWRIKREPVDVAALLPPSLVRRLIGWLPGSRLA